MKILVLCFFISAVCAVNLSKFMKKAGEAASRLPVLSLNTSSASVVNDRLASKGDNNGNKSLFVSVKSAKEITDNNANVISDKPCSRTLMPPLRSINLKVLTIDAVKAVKKERSDNDGTHSHVDDESYLIHSDTDGYNQSSDELFDENKRSSETPQMINLVRNGEKSRKKLSLKKFIMSFEKPVLGSVAPTREFSVAELSFPQYKTPSDILNFPRLRTVDLPIHIDCKMHKRL